MTTPRTPITTVRNQDARTHYPRHQNKQPQTCWAGVRLPSGRGVVGGRAKQHRAASELSISIVFFLWEYRGSRGLSCPWTELKQIAFWCPRNGQRVLTELGAWLAVRAAQSITCVSVWALRPSGLSCDLSAPWRSPWVVDGLLTVSVVCLNTTLCMDTGVGISYHCHMPQNVIIL